LSATNFELAAAEAFLHDLPELPSLSPAASQIIQSINDGNDNFQDLGRIVEGDPVLATRVLKVANSAFYAAPSRMSSLTAAIGRLGLTEMRTLICSAALIRQFEGAKAAIGLDLFWNHSVATALACQVIVEPGPLRPGQMLGDNPYYLAGLMHHLGLLVEAIHAPARFEQACARANETGGSMEQAECELFGFGHSATGAALFDLWRVPDIIRQAALYHLDPDACPGDGKAAQVVHLAGLLAHETGAYSFEGVAPWVSESAFHRLGWSLERLPELMDRLKRANNQAGGLVQALAGG
jgi:HD-like signal output (HDOD) protein